MSLEQPSAEHWIKHLDLQAHPEGGYYKQITRGNYVVPNQRGKRRFAYSTIYFLLTAASPSHLHRLCSDEVWVWHAGDALQVHTIYRQPFDEELISRCEDAPPTDPETLAQLESFTPQHVALQYDANKKAADYQHYACTHVGPHVDRGEQLQYTVPADAIFGSTLAPGGPHGYSLVSCIVSPAFDFRDFELFTQQDLMALCPQHEVIIRKLAYVELPRPSATAVTVAAAAE